MSEEDDCLISSVVEFFNQMNKIAVLHLYIQNDHEVCVCVGI